MSLPSPSQLLGAGNFPSWYPGQEELLEQSLDWYYSPARFLGLSVSTGSGKSLSSLLLAKLSEARTVVLTATKGLQQQYLDIAKNVEGMVVKGQNNFPCILVNNLTADEGPCHDGLPCAVREQCPYRVQLKKALDSNLVITNYAYWLAQTNFSSGLGEFGLMICTVGDTLVTLADGSTARIADIVNKRLKVTVVSVDLSSGRLVSSPVVGWQRVRPAWSYMLKITTASGSVILTPDHPVWTSSGYRRADCIKEGDFVYADNSRCRSVNFGNNARGWLSVSGEECDVKCAATYSPLKQAGRTDSGQVGRSPQSGSLRATHCAEWWLGGGTVRVPDSVIGRVDSLSPPYVPRASENSIDRVAGQGGCCRAGLVVHGRRFLVSGEPYCCDKQSFIQSKREQSFEKVVGRKVWGDLSRCQGWTWEGIFPVVGLYREEQVISPDRTLRYSESGLQSSLHESSVAMYGLWEGVPQSAQHEGLLKTLRGDCRQGGKSYLVGKEVQVVSVERIKSPDYVYDITVEATHNFFANGHLVKNCDEGHSCFGAMENYLTIFLSRLDIQPIGISFPESADQWNVWQSWAEVSTPIAADAVNRIEQEMKQYRSKNQLVPPHVSRVYRTTSGIHARLKRLSSVNEEWVIQKTYHGYRFVPKWVSNYSLHLFHDTPKVVLMSAILSHRSADYLGVPSNGSRSWIEMDSYFPPENTPIWHIPTARINYRTDDYGATIWCSRIDQIIQRRLDRKGIVFTVSYERAKMLLSRSRFKDIMFTHGTKDVIQVVDKFKKAPAPAVLVSPSVTTGYDFPMDISGHGIPQYIVLGKVAYPDTSEIVTKARHADDKDWASYLAMESIVQSAGRMTRSVDDKCEIFCIDDSWKWFYPKFKHFAPSWFRERVMGSLDTVPNPLF